MRPNPVMHEVKRSSVSNGEGKVMQADVGAPVERNRMRWIGDLPQRQDDLAF